jgi:hypothetical protein
MEMAPEVEKEGRKMCELKKEAKKSCITADAVFLFGPGEGAGGEKKGEF